MQHHAAIFVQLLSGPMLAKMTSQGEEVILRPLNPDGVRLGPGWARNMKKRMKEAEALEDENASLQLRLAEAEEAATRAQAEAKQTQDDTNKLKDICRLLQAALEEEKQRALNLDQDLMKARAELSKTKDFLRFMVYDLTDLPDTQLDVAVEDMETQPADLAAGHREEL